MSPWHACLLKLNAVYLLTSPPLRPAWAAVYWSLRDKGATRRPCEIIYKTDQITYNKSDFNNEKDSVA